MTGILAYLIGTCISLAGILHLLSIDAKRRRVLGLKGKPARFRSRLAGWSAVLLPGCLLIATGQASALLIWFGTVPVSAWAIISRRPKSGSSSCPPQ